MSTEPRLPIPVTTVHQVKGMTLDTVLFVFGSTSRGQSVSFKELSTPEEFPKEKQRIVYVAMSRPKYLLAIGVPSNVGNSEITKKLGDEVRIIE